MDADLKARWVQALRSGDYQQGHEQLLTTEDEDGRSVALHCCLGVLCAIQGADFNARERDADHGVDRPLRRLPVAPPRYAGGLTSKEQERLYSMNDGVDYAEGAEMKMHSFAELADYIEENL